VFLRDAQACIWLAAAAESTALNIASDAASNRPSSAQDIARHCYNTAQEETWDGGLDVEARVGPHQVLQQPPLR